MNRIAKASLKLAAVRREIVRKVRQVGIWATGIHIASRLMDYIRELLTPAGNKIDPFDPKYGTDTSGFIGVGALDIPPDQLEHSMQYRPIWEDEFTTTLASLPVICEDLIFIDLGSGKGRALLLASLFPFRRIIGVELARTLHDVAARNVQIFKDSRQQCKKIETVNENALTFEIPEEPTLFFLANPFDDYVMQAVVSHIEDSLKKHPRKLYIWYVRPIYRKALDGAGFLRLVNDTGRYAFYENHLAPVP